MSLADFVVVLNTLALATGKTLTDETVVVYFKALQDVPLLTFQSAAGRLVKTEKFFPAPGVIRAACDQAKGSSWQTFTVPALPPSGVLDDDDPRLWYACSTCQDSGWASNWCPGSVNAALPPGPAALPPERQWDMRHCGSHACARFGAKGYGHEFVTRCPCYTSNTVIRKRLDARKQYAETK